MAWPAGRVASGLFLLSFLPAWAGSFVSESSRAVDDALAGKMPGPPAQAIFSTYTPGAKFLEGNYTRNPTLWLDHTDLSFIMAHNSMGGYQWGPQVITPRHGIFAWHITTQNFGVGSQVQYVDANNNVSTRTIAAMTQVAGTDIGLCAFDRDLPVGIKPAQVLPIDWAHQLGNFFGATPPLAVCFTDGQVTPYRFLYCGQVASRAGSFFMLGSPTGAQRQAFGAQVVTGDSSSPVFMIVHHQAVLLGCFFGGGYGSGPFVSDYHSLINIDLKRLSIFVGAASSYQLSDVDITAWARP